MRWTHGVTRVLVYDFACPRRLGPRGIFIVVEAHSEKHLPYSRSIYFAHKIKIVNAVVPPSCVVQGVLLAVSLRVCHFLVTNWFGTAVTIFPGGHDDIPSIFTVCCFLTR